MAIPTEGIDGDTFDDRYREATENINSTIRTIHDTLETLKRERERYSSTDKIPSLLTQLYNQLLEYKMLHNSLIVNDEEAVSDYSCAKDTVAAFNKSVDRVNEDIKDLKNHISKSHFLAIWSEDEINFINNEMEKITQSLKPIEYARSEVSFCAYYNDVGVGD